MSKCGCIAEPAGPAQNRGREKIQRCVRALSRFGHFRWQGEGSFNSLGFAIHELKRAEKRIAIKREIRVSHTHF